MGVAARQAADAALVAATRQAATELSSVAPLAGPPAAPAPPRTAVHASHAPRAAPLLLPVPLLRAPGARDAAGTSSLVAAGSLPVASVETASVQLSPLRAAREPAVAAHVARRLAATVPRALAPADGASRVAGARGARASAAGRAAGRAAAAEKRAAAKKRKWPTATVGRLEADLHDCADRRAGTKRVRVEGDAAGESRQGYIPPVLPQVLESPNTTKKMLEDLCTVRTIPFGAADSVESLKTSLRRFNASSATTWGAQMQFALVFVRDHAQRSRGGLLPCQAAMRHPSAVGVDRSSELEATGRLPAPAVVPLFGTCTPPTPPLVSIDGPAASPPSACAPHPRPPVYSATPPPTVHPRARSFSPPPHINPSPRPPLYEPSTRPPRQRSLPASGEVSPNLSIGGVAPPFRRPSTIYAAKMVQAMAAEEEQASRALATAEQVAVVQGTLNDVTRRLEAHAQSQTAANVRADTAFAALSHASAAAARPPQPETRAVTPRQAGRTGGLVPVAASRQEAAAADAAAAADNASAAVPDVVAAYHSPLIRDWAMPVEMMTNRMEAKPLFHQLSEMVRLCHVSVGQPGLFGSLACNQLYMEGVARMKADGLDGGAGGRENKVKTEKMHNVVKNTAKRYIKELHWLHGHLPHLFKPPAEATFENMAKVKIEGDDYTALTAALNLEANALGLPDDHDIRHPTQARSNTLRGVISAKAGRTGKTCIVEEMLSSSPFRELLAQAQKNIIKKYAYLCCCTRVD